jgi:hypothetical protein
MKIPGSGASGQDPQFFEFASNEPTPEGIDQVSGGFDPVHGLRRRKNGLGNQMGRVASQIGEVAEKIDENVRNYAESIQISGAPAVPEVIQALNPEEQETVRAEARQNFKKKSESRLASIKDRQIENVEQHADGFSEISDEEKQKICGRIEHAYQKNCDAIQHTMEELFGTDVESPR